MKLPTKKITKFNFYKDFKLKRIKIKFKFEYFIPIVLILVTLPLFNRMFTQRNELKYLYIAQNIIKNENPFVYYLSGKLYTDKPPLFFWIIILSKFIFRNYYTYGIVIFNIFIESFLLIKLYRFLKIKFDENIAIMSIFITFTGILQYVSVIVVRMDIYLSCFIALSLLNFFECYEKNDYQKNWITFVYIGFAFLFKGIVGLLTPLLVIILFKFTASKKYSLKETGFYKGLSIILAFVLFWIIPAYISLGNIFINELFFKQLFGRAVKAFAHKRPFYYYLYTLPMTVFPWTVYSVYVIYQSVVLWIKEKNTNDFEKFLLIWIFSTLFYLSVSSSKLVIYLLPIVTPIGILTAINYRKIPFETKNILFFITISIFIVASIVMIFSNSRDFVPFKVISIFSLFNIGMVSLLLFLKAGKKAGFIFLGLLFPIVTFVAGFNISKINKMTDARNYDSNYIYIEKK